ncbi:MAG: PEGA domain-containing protein [Fibrobacteres bacterium]|nr:PEGA domain-containing protein [Fibrobacterota bacterium]
MIRFVSVIIGMMGASGVAIAQERPTMGVLEASLAGKDYDPELKPVLTSMVRGNVVKVVRDSVDVVEGSKLEKMIQTNSGECSGADCLAKFTRQVGLDYLLETRMLFRKGSWTATLKLASAKSENLLSEETSTFESEADLQKGLPVMVGQVVKSLSKSRVPGPGEESRAGDGFAASVQKVVPRFLSEPAGAAVTLDGNLLCTTPCGKAIAPGEHLVLMGKDGFRQRREKINLVENGQGIDWTLEPITTSLRLEATDDRTGDDLIADVYLDGARVGETPYTGLVSVAEHRIEVVPPKMDRATLTLIAEEGVPLLHRVHFQSPAPQEKPRVAVPPVPLPQAPGAPEQKPETRSNRTLYWVGGGLGLVGIGTAVVLLVRSSTSTTAASPQPQTIQMVQP